MSKKIEWMGNSKGLLKRFPEMTSRKAGFELRQVQRGFLPTDWKPMSGVGPGCMEIRLHQPHEHRVIYVAKFEEVVYVLHAFEKKSQKTCKRDIEIAAKNYKEVIRSRGGK